MKLTKKEIQEGFQDAKRIQESILPKVDFIKQLLPEFFILYLPKNTISGDFYWIEEVNDIILFAVGDCTGHGISGAMLTVMCHHALNSAVRDHGKVIPGHILDKTLDIVRSEIRKNGGKINDGMEIWLCSKQGSRIKYAGANSPIWHVSKGGITIKQPSKQPIQAIDNPIYYYTEEFDVKKGDAIYLFSDGFQDQFGGDKNKKFSPQQMRNLILEINQLSMNEQKTILLKSFNRWKGKVDQIDDVCVMGVRV